MAILSAWTQQMKMWIRRMRIRHQSGGSMTAAVIPVKHICTPAAVPAVCTAWIRKPEKPYRRLHFPPNWEHLPVPSVMHPAASIFPQRTDMYVHIHWQRTDCRIQSMHSRSGWMTQSVEPLWYIREDFMWEVPVRIRMAQFTVRIIWMWWISEKTVHWAWLTRWMSADSRKEAVHWPQLMKNRPDMSTYILRQTVQMEVSICWKIKQGLPARARAAGCFISRARSMETAAVPCWQIKMAICMSGMNPVGCMPSNLPPCIWKMLSF